MSTMYVVTAELAHKPTEAVTDWIVEYLADWHAVAAEARREHGAEIDYEDA